MSLGDNDQETKTVEGRVGQLVRGKAKKELPAHDCQDCQSYYKYRGFSGSALQEQLEKCSRHRYHVKREASPDHYWDVDMPDSPEALRRGYFIDDTTKTRKADQREDERKATESSATQDNQDMTPTTPIKSKEKKYTVQNFDWDALEEAQIKE